MSENPLDEGNPNAASGDEMRRIRGVLKEIVAFAEHASLTGAMSGGARQAVKQCNALVGRLQEITAFPPYLLVTVEEDASLDEVGFAARVLNAYLEEDASPTTPLHGLAEDLEEIKEMKKMGRWVRAQLEELPDWMKGQAAGSHPGGPPAQETAPEG